MEVGIEEEKANIKSWEDSDVLRFAVTQKLVRITCETLHMVDEARCGITSFADKDRYI